MQAIEVNQILHSLKKNIFSMNIVRITKFDIDCAQFEHLSSGKIKP